MQNIPITEMDMLTPKPILKSYLVEKITNKRKRNGKVKIIKLLFIHRSTICIIF